MGELNPRPFTHIPWSPHRRHTLDPRIMKAVVLFVVMFAGCTNAWFFSFGRNEETTATAQRRPVDDTCESFGEAGTCAFFNCFEQRLPCGHDWYIMRFGNKYCNRFESRMETFT